MTTLPNFCRGCLKYDKNLIDLEHIENEPKETLLSKLQYCVSEVDWHACKPLLCHPCIKRMNSAYVFKKQCQESWNMINNYLNWMNGSEKNNSKIQAGSDNSFMLIPNTNVINILLSPQVQNNSIQNVVFNVVPNQSRTENGDGKDNNQNMFPNMHTNTNTVDEEEKSVNLNQILTKSKTEELSVEIDPTDFGLEDDHSSNYQIEIGTAEWDNFQKLASQFKLNGGTTKVEPKPNLFTNFVPILPKQSPPIEGRDDNFGTSGNHFLSSQLFLDFHCEQCPRQFNSLAQLKSHVKDVHSDQKLFTCEYCQAEFHLKKDYETCRTSHKIETNSITRVDCSPVKTATSDGTDCNLVCEYCYRQFSTLPGLLRHKVRKHNQKAKKKYFVKGMKNARCDICNRDFSTQSYMQLHRKLHLREETGHKRKLSQRIKYGTFEQHKSLVPIRPKEDRSNNLVIS